MTGIYLKRRSESIARFSPKRVVGVEPAGSLWLEQALARENPGDTAGEVSLPQRADICVVGGGLTGLWTAIKAKLKQPDATVVLLEAVVCGSGASGRSGGFVMTAWSKFASLRKLCGEEEALRFALAAEDAVGAIGRFCADHEIDAGFHQGGWLWTATNRSQLDAWSSAMEAIESAGASPYVALGPEEVAQRSGSAMHIGGIFEAKAGIVQPALLARGLAKVARELGVTICERTALLELEAGSTARLRTSRGSISADHTVLALNAWAAEIAEVRRTLMVVASDVIATAPIPERISAIGWERDMSISDSRRLVNYYRISEDSRVVFGKGGGALAMGGRIDASFHGISPRAEEVRAQMQRIYPALSDVTVARSWRGPIDYSLSGLPFFAPLSRHQTVLVAAGFSGNGVGPSFVAGEVLASMALGEEDHPAPAALCRVPGGALPPEPVRFLGGKVVRAAVARKEAAEDRENRPSALTSLVASLDPTSFVDRGSA